MAGAVLLLGKTCLRFTGACAAVSPVRGRRTRRRGERDLVLEWAGRDVCVLGLTKVAVGSLAAGGAVLGPVGAVVSGVAAAAPTRPAVPLLRQLGTSLCSRALSPSVWCPGGSGRGGTITGGVVGEGLLFIKVPACTCGGCMGAPIAACSACAAACLSTVASVTRESSPIRMLSVRGGAALLAAVVALLCSCLIPANLCPAVTALLFRLQAVRGKAVTRNRGSTSWSRRSSLCTAVGFSTIPASSSAQTKRT